MKIAAVTDDGQSINQHFGRASYYLVLTVEDGKIADRELRKKPGHSEFSNQPHNVHMHGESRGFDPAAQDRHTLMADAIADCQVVLCGGMGAGAFQSLNERGIEPVLTDIPQIEDAVQAYLDGRIVNLTNRLH
jgi:predicted Fe-Mo cluster-binding NifX family protein